MNFDPSHLPAASWQSRLAALSGRGVPDTDPRMVQCRRALAFHRAAKAVTAEREVFGEDGVSALKELLLDLVANTEAVSVP